MRTMFADTKERGSMPGEKAGYVFGYLLFTAVMVFVLSAAGKLPQNWSYSRFT